MCGCKGLEIDVADKWQKTPLHYASQRGASICSLYLVQRKALLESKDIYGNTPLGVGLMYQHYNYGILLIQKGASVHPLTFREDPDRIKKMWEEELKAQKALYKTQKKGENKAAKEDDEEMKDEEEDSGMTSEKKPKFAKHNYKKHQNMFANKVHMQYYDEEDYDEEDDEESEDDDDVHQENVFNQQNAFGQNVFAMKATRANVYNPWGASQPAA